MGIERREADILPSNVVEGKGLYATVGVHADVRQELFGYMHSDGVLDNDQGDLYLSYLSISDPESVLSCTTSYSNAFQPCSTRVFLS